jgi:hypothetical protein
LKHTQEEVAFNNFSLIKPISWELVKLEGIDSQVGVLITENGDTINYEYGKNAQRIESNLLKVLPDNMFDEITDESIFRYSKSPDLDQDLGIFLDEYFIFDSLKNSRIQIPKQIGKGLTGFYSEKLNKDGDRLTIVGKNLKKEEQEELLKLFETITFR